MVDYETERDDEQAVVRLQFAVSVAQAQTQLESVLGQ